MKDMNNKLFHGTVRHRRHTVKYHEFSYKLFMVHVDIGNIQKIFKPYWLWSVERFNYVSFYRKNYFGPKDEPLLQTVKTRIAAHSGQEIDKVYLLTNLSYLGYCFNPISLYFCFNNNELVNIIAEVSNTPWRETKVYILDPEEKSEGYYQTVFEKKLHVSPFLGMDYRYQFNCKYTDNKIMVHLENWQNDERHFDATLDLTGVEMNHHNLRWALIRHPIMTIKVIFAIHWQALKLWLKRVPVFTHQEQQDIEPHK